MMEKREIRIDEFIQNLTSRNRSERIAIFIWGVLVYAISFSIFFSPQDIVTGGTTGLSLIIHHIFGMDPSIFVFVASFLLLIVGFFLLGKESTIKTIFGVILLPIFMEFSSIFPRLFHLEISSLFLTIFFGGILMGLGNGMIIRSGFSVGGFQTIYQVFYKYFGISIGKSTLWLNAILIAFSGLIFSFSNALYAIIGLYISSIVTDKVMLESSITKTFFIITEKEAEISQYVVENLGYGVTVMNAVGGYSGQEKKILMCAVPTRHYYELKEMIQEIDQEVFFLITDTYEIYGGV